MGTPVRSETVTPPCSIATPLTLPASSLKSRRNAIVVPAKPPKKTPNSSSLVMLLRSPWFHPSPCASSLSLTSPHWVASPYVSSNPSTSRTLPPERSPRPLKRPPRRSELKLRKPIAPENTLECAAHLQSHHLCRPVNEKPLHFLLTLHLSLFLSMLKNLVRFLLSDWILLHCFHHKEVRRKTKLFSLFI